MYLRIYVVGLFSFFLILRTGALFLFWGGSKGAVLDPPNVLFFAGFVAPNVSFGGGSLWRWPRISWWSNFSWDMFFQLASCACFVSCQCPYQSEFVGHIWGMRGRSCARRRRLGLETACHNGRSPARFRTPRYCRLWHGNMDIHMPAVCLPFLCYCVRSLRHILVPGYALLPRLSGVQCLRLGCVFPVRIFAQVLSCVPLDLLLLFLHPSHSLRLAHAVFVAFAGFPRALLARPLYLCLGDLLTRLPSCFWSTYWGSFLFLEGLQRCHFAPLRMTIFCLAWARI